MSEYIFTSESVSEGHPDKMADQISDAILDAILAEDKNARVACEAVLKTGMAMIVGEITTTAKPDYEEIIRHTIQEIGYDSSDKGFDYKTCAVITSIGLQSPDINQGVDKSDPKDQGAGDQGIMFGFATNETDVLMPAALTYSHRLMETQAKLRKSGNDYLRPDAKSQVSIRYENNKPVGIDAIVLSTQHHDDISQTDLNELVMEEIIKPVLEPTGLLHAKTKYHINPTGVFVIGGPMGDAGLTGRKIIVDTYGGASRHGGGAFSGKDPSKVDRSAAYMGRYIAKNIVAAGLADKCEVQISYAIGLVEPTSIMIETFGTGKVDDASIISLIRNNFDLTPYGIVETLDLLNADKIKYHKTAAYGHFGRENMNFTWENLDKVSALKA